jgi:hypothetical protein
MNCLVSFLALVFSPQAYAAVISSAAKAQEAAKSFHALRAGEKAAQQIVDPAMVLSVGSYEVQVTSGPCGGPRDGYEAFEVTTDRTCHPVAIKLVFSN